ncbi:alpha/beta fold hydrolase [Nonomuraea endophytica]|uniref:Proline iminopeptidase n=1 Tax=Nonomuraea endophytica TaxID=714136 RepID=A0A7W8A360_9ACTN|nr:alpha/beta fold hydrolase [Nonomuraea endophytica]MBB5078659.1 proline iminopeptidase [Nonomuraea endophytica]
MRRFLRVAGRLVCGLAVLLLSPVLGLATLAGMATVMAGPQVFSVTGLAVFASVFYLGLLLCVPRPAARWARWARAVALLGVEAVVVWHVCAQVLTEPPGTPPPAARVEGQREWELPTGSRLAYVRVAAGKASAAPVVVLQGRGDLAGDAAFFGQLAEGGREVYVYDALGTGRSERLRDPRGYGLPRDVSDLEAIRDELGAERLVLVGHGEGARLAAAYLGAFPGRVERVVFSSPAPLRPPPTVLGFPAPGESLRVPDVDARMLVTHALLRVEPQAARAFAGDGELDARLDRTRALASASYHCPGAKLTPEPRGSGGYASLAPRDVEPPAASGVPVLVVKGSCDFQPWSSIRDYPRGGLVYVEDAGHAVYADRPGPYLKALRSFLAGRPTGTPAGDRPPPGYLGPA